MDRSRSPHTISTIIRPYRETDAAACTEVINLAFELEDGMNEAARSLVRGRNVESELRRELAAAYTLVAEEDGAVCGVGLLRDGEIKRLYVLPRVHRRGIGRALMTELEAEARRHGVAVLRLGAAPASVGFYRLLGFIDDGPVERVRGETVFRFFPMHKALTA